MQEVSESTAAADGELLTRLQPREVMARIYREAVRLSQLEQAIEDKKREVQDLVDERNRVARVALPALFDHLHTDRIGVPGEKADVVLDFHIHAAILRDWPDEDKQAAYAELERLQADDLLKHTVLVSFGKGEGELAADFVRYISRWNQMGGRRVAIDREVHWQTLTAFVRRMRKKLVPMNLKALGATVTREAKIVWRT